MKIYKDGNQFCLVADDFINLQESPALFFPAESEIGKAIESEIVHVGELDRALHVALIKIGAKDFDSLVHGLNKSIQTLIKNGLPHYEFGCNEDFSYIISSRINIK